MSFDRGQCQIPYPSPGPKGWEFQLTGALAGYQAKLKYRFNFNSAYHFKPNRNISPGRLLSRSPDRLLCNISSLCLSFKYIYSKKLPVVFAFDEVQRKPNFVA